MAATSHSSPRTTRTARSSSCPKVEYDKTDFAASRRSDEAGGDEAYFEYLKESLYASLEAAQPGQVNVFHFTVHPGEFRGDRQDPFGVIEKFLTEVVDPLVASAVMCNG
jgi:hypothetical protein